MHRSTTAVSFLALGLWSASAGAEYTGPGATPVATNVAAILASPKDDQNVVLRGTIVRQEGKKKYVFSDGTSQIRVEISDKIFPAQQVDATTQVEIVGEVEKDFLRSPHIDVDAMTVVATATP